MTPATAAPLVRIGSIAEFAALRCALLAADFTESAICERMGFKRISAFPLDAANTNEAEPDDALGLLVRYLMAGAPVSPKAAERLPMKELRALGMVIEQPSGHFCSPAILYPMHGVYIASDRPVPLEGVGGSRPHDDFVYPALTPNTELFLDLVPFGPCEALLDLCAGTGVAAIAGATRGARHSWSLDLTARSTHFAEFNRLLNGLDNVTALEGDLYEPARGMTFDRIVAHPPYVAVFRHQYIFDSGGKDGEHIVGGLIRGLPDFLRPGGRFYALSMATDREKPLELRIREWLGDAHSEFDVILVVRQLRSAMEYSAEAIIRYQGSSDDIRAWRDFFNELKIRQFVYSFITIQRHAKPRQPFTVRRQTGPKTGPKEHAWLVDWETSLAERGLEPVLDLKPRTVPGVRLQSGHQLTPGGWAANSFSIQTSHPFNMDLDCDPWAPHLLACADGGRTTAELLEVLKQDGAMRPDTPPIEFARLVSMLVSGGFLEV
jgi:SAM-dependent methyltransferase